MSHKNIVVHVSTLHRRDDPRILGKELRTLARTYEGKFYYFVNDGLGIENQEQPDITIVDLNIDVESKLRRMLLVPFSMLKKVRDVNPSIVHFHDPELIFIGIIFRLLGVKVIYDVHEDVPRQILSKVWIHAALRYPISIFVSAIENVAVRFFSGVVCATDTIRARFPKEKSITMRNFPVSSELANLEHSKASYTSRPHTFAYIGGMLAIRGAKEMVDAIDMVESNSSELVIAGVFTDKELESEVITCSGWRKVKFLGWVGREEVKSTLAECRAGLVVLHPTINYIDALPVKMFEYMSAGLPVIASDFPLWREIVDGCGCGILVNPQNTKEISDAMQWLLDNPDQAFEMGCRGRAAVLGKYNWESESSELTKFYDGIIL